MRENNAPLFVLTEWQMKFLNKIFKGRYWLPIFCYNNFTWRCG